MDNLTHSLFALTLARTPLAAAGAASSPERASARGSLATTMALLLASNAPDIDIVATIGGSSNYLEWHRGPSHGPLGIVGLGLATAALVWTGSRIAASRREGGGCPTFVRLLVISIIGVAAHILMDVPTSYGTRLMSPFSWRWFAMDLLPIIDVYLLALLAAGLLLGSAYVRERQRLATIVLVMMAANYGVRAITHQQALGITHRVFGHALPQPCDEGAADVSLLDSWPRAASARVAAGGEPCLIDIAAIPSFASPFRWRVVAQLTNAYTEHNINVLDRSLGDAGSGPPASISRIPNEWSPVVVQAATTRPVQVLLGFSRFPHVRVTADPSGGSRVTFTDMRFAAGLDNPRMQARRSALFTVTVKVGANREIDEIE